MKNNILLLMIQVFLRKIFLLNLSDYIRKITVEKCSLIKIFNIKLASAKLNLMYKAHLNTQIVYREKVCGYRRY